MEDITLIEKQIESAEKELDRLKKEKTKLEYKIKHLKSLKQPIAEENISFNKKLTTDITSESNNEQKVTLFRTLFRGREDVFPKRFESKRTGKSGYQPVCRNEWIRPICQKPKVKCGDCKSRDFVPITNEVVYNHLIGFDPADRYQKEFVMGVYPMLVDESCWFLAVDFDKESDEF